MPINPLQYPCLENPMDGGAWKAAVHGVTKSWTRMSDFTFTFHFHALEKEMATHSSVLAWRIPGTAEPGGLPSMGSHRVRHDWSDLAATAAAVPIKATTTTKGGKKGKKIQKNLQNKSKHKNNKCFYWVTAVRVLSLIGSHSPPDLPRCPPTLCWSLDLLWGSSHSHVVLLLCVLASDVHSCQN